MADWPQDKVEAVLVAPNATMAQRIAAKEMMLAAGGDTNARRDVSDYSGNKPTQRNENLTEIVHVRRTVVHMPADSPHARN